MKKKINYNIKEKRGLSKAILEKMLKKWREKLRMDDWKINLKIVDFERKDFRQSGDFIANPQKKTATILLTWNPWRVDEEYTLLHEMIHVLLYDYDLFCEKQVLKHSKPFTGKHDLYMGKLEELVHQLTRVIIGREEYKKADKK